MWGVGDRKGGAAVGWGRVIRTVASGWIFRRDGQDSLCGEDGIEDLKEVFKSFMLQKERETVTLAEKVNDVNTSQVYNFCFKN